MIEGRQDDTSDSLTVENAAQSVERLLSLEEDRKPPREKPAPKAPEEEAAPEPEPEPEEEEALPEEDGESAETDGDETEEEAPEPRSYRVKVDGQELEVTEDELLKGYSRTADYTRKTQALAEQSKASAAEAEAVRAERQKYVTGLTTIEQALTQLSPAEPNWEEERVNDPDNFATKWATWQQHQKHLGAIREERERTQQKIHADYQTAEKTRLTAERDLLVEAIPEWKDPEVAKVQRGKLAEFARSVGFTDAELSEVTDHRAILLLNDAMRYREGQKTRPAVRAKIEAVRVVPPGPASSTRRAPVTEVTKAKQRLAKTGRTEDAANAILKMMG